MTTRPIAAEHGAPATAPHHETAHGGSASDAKPANINNAQHGTTTTNKKIT